MNQATPQQVAYAYVTVASHLTEVRIPTIAEVAAPRGCPTTALALPPDALIFRDIDVQRAAIDRVEELWAVCSGRITHAKADAELVANLKGSIDHYQRRYAREKCFLAVELAIEKGKVPWPGEIAGYIRDADSRLTWGSHLSRRRSTSARTRRTRGRARHHCPRAVRRGAEDQDPARETREARLDLERAQAALDGAIMAFSGFEVEPAAIRRLRESL